MLKDLMYEKGFKENIVSTTYFDLVINKTANGIKMICLYIFKRDKYNEYKQFSLVLRQITNLQKKYYSKEINVYSNDSNYIKTTMPRIMFRIDKKMIVLKCYFNGRTTEKDYERLKEEIETDTGMQFIESDLRNGYYYVNFGLKNNVKPQPTFIYNLKQDEKIDYTIPIGDTFGKPVLWDYKKYPHALIVGATGSGKTSFMYYVLSSILSFTECYCIDGKCIDYTTTQHLFTKYCDVSEPQKALDFVNEFYDTMLERRTLIKQKQLEGLEINDIYDLGMKPKFLLIDELSSIAEALNPKAPKNEVSEKENFNNKLGQLLRLGRAFGTIILIAMQRPDTKFIPGEARNNLSLKIALGTPDDETYSMTFGKGYSDLKPCDVGQAYMMIQGKVRYIEVPYCKKIMINSN